MFAGRRCLRLFWHGHDNVFLDLREYSCMGACSCSKVPIALMGDSRFARCLSGRRYCIPVRRLSLTHQLPSAFQPSCTSAGAHAQKFPSPHGIFTCFALVLAGWRCDHRRWHGDLVIVHHHWQHSFLGACSRSKFPIAPRGKLLTCLPQLSLAQLQTLWSTTQGVRATETLKISHRPDGKMADMLAPTHACTTANTSVNYSG